MDEMIVDREPMPDNYKGVDNTADELYLKCRKRFMFFKHKKSKVFSRFIAHEIQNVLDWNSPSYNKKKIEVLRHFWKEVYYSIDRIKGIKK